MMLVEVTSIPKEELPIEPFKAHLQLGSGFSDDGLQDEVLESYIRAAMAAIEARIGKVLMTRRLAWTLTRWSNDDAQPLPVAPVSQIHVLALTDGSGMETTVDPASYKLEKDTHRPRLVATGSLPGIATGGSATISFDAGFGPDWNDVPADLAQAVFLLAAHYYENRRDASGAGGLMPFGVMALLETHRNIRLLGARV